MRRRLVVEPLEDRVNPAPVLYANDAAGALYTVDAATGSVNIIGNTGTVMTDIGFATDGKLFGVDTVSNLYRIDPDTAAITLVGPFGFPVTALAFNGGNGLYAAGTGFHYKFFHESAAGGHLIGNFPASTVAGDVAFDTQNNAYITTQNNELARVSYSDGSLTVIGALGFDAVEGLAFANGVMYGVSRTTSQVITINLNTGAGTAVSTHAGPATTGLTFFGEHVTFDAEPNDLPAQSQTLTTPVDILRGRISNVLDTDRYTVTLQQGDTWKVGIDLAPENGWADMGPAFEITDANGTLVASASDSHTVVFTTATTATYHLTLTSRNDFAAFSGEYALRTSVESFGGTTETEPNDAAANATALTAQATFRGALTSAADVDSYTINAGAGQAIVVNHSGAFATNPATRIYAPDGTLIATDRTGAGLHVVLTQSGLHRIAVGSDNIAGTVTGQYVGQVVVADRPLAEAAAENGFANAPVVDFGPYVISANYLSSTAAFTDQGLIGSYVNQSLRTRPAQDDWRVSQTIAGSRLDPTIHFPRNGWGFRDPLGLTGGTDNDWENYSVQWDGFINVVTDGTRLSLASDDGSRMWIDLNNDGVFDSSGPEFLDNYWSYEHGVILLSTGPIPAGVHRIRIQYEEVTGGNNAFLLWDDRAHSAEIGALYQFRTQIGTLSSLDDVDVFAFDLAATAMYDFRLQTSPGRLSTQSRELTLYDEFGHPLHYSTSGAITTDEPFHYRPVYTGRYYLAIRATTEAGLGSYSIGSYAFREFPRYRDVPLFYQNHTNYDFTEQVPGLLAFFESRFDIYQVDMTETNPGTGSEHVDWRLAYEPTASGGGFQGGNYGERRPSGAGLGQVTYQPMRLLDAVHGLAFHENGHGIGIYHDRHPLSVQGYGSQYDLFPVGTMTEGENLVPTPRIQNERNYMDWVLEAGRIVVEGEGNDTRASAQQLAPYIAEMGQDADPRNDQAVVAGALSRAGDVDWYSFAAAAGETFAIDIESAEFQFPLDARLDLFDSAGNLLASNLQALDRDSGIASVDPYLMYTFASAGTYFVRVSGEHGTSGNYRLKVSPERTFDQAGPRITSSWPDGGSTIDSTRMLTFWTNDQLDPATLTGANIIVSGRTTGVHSGTAVFNHLDSVLTWQADSPLPPDVYTVTITSGVTDLRGNPIDGETGGVLAWPAISGNGLAGGNFVTTFTVNSTDTVAAEVYYSQFYRQDHNRGLIDLWFTDEVDLSDLYTRNFTLHGSGEDRAFGTSDDTFAPLDTYYSAIHNTVYRLMRAYTRGLPDPGTYRVEGTVLDAAGFTVSVSRDITVALDVPEGFLFTTASLTTPGLVGSYIDDSLRTYAPQDDWRVTQTVAGTRIDPIIAFNTESLGLRSEVNLTKGSDPNWEDFSVQWDGFIAIPTNGVRLWTRTDDGSRMWIDLNNDGVFDSSGDEFVNNNWGFGQGVFAGPASVPLAAGTYRIRIQYEEEFGGNRAFLSWDYTGAEPRYENARHGVSVIDVSVQPNTTVTTAPSALTVTFNGAVDPATLNASTFTLLYSPDERFFDGNDIAFADADGTIAYDAARHEATFAPAAWPAGYYLLQLSDNIASPDGRCLDGEYLDTNIAGYVPLDGWQDSPSGDTRPGGDYRAFFRVDAPLAATVDMDAAAIVYGDDGTVTVTVSAAFGTPGGTVELVVDGGTPISATLIGGSATFALDSLQAGSHTLVANYLGSANYVSDSDSDSIGVSPASLTVTAANKSKVYGSALPSLTYTLAGLVDGDTQVGVLNGQLATSATAASPVAGYAITKGTLALTGSNYTLTFVPGTLAVTPANLAVTASNRTKAYGAALPTLTFAVSGLVNGDAQAGVLSGSLTTAATAASPVGNYSISQGSLALTTGNYSLAFTAGTLSVTPATLTVTAANKSKTYGAANPSLTYTATGFVNGDPPTVLTGSLATTATASSPVGSHPITAGSLAAANYTIAFTAGTLTINRAPLTIAADDKTRPANRSNPPLTAQYSGFVNGDNSGVVSNLNLVTTAVTSSPEGDYPITSSTTPTAANYTIAFVPGTLTVTASVGGTTQLPSETAVGSGDGRSARVNAYDSDGDLITSFAPFGLFYSGGVRTATADFDGDGRTDVVVGTGPGIATSVRVYSGRNGDELFRVAPFESSFRGGVYVSAGDLTGDGVPELIITPDEGGGPRVKVYQGPNFTTLADFLGIDDANFRGGARTSVGDFNGDGSGDLVVAAGFGGGPRVAVFDGAALASTRTKLFNDFFLFEQRLRNGAFIAAADVDSDGLADLIGGGGPGGGPRVLILDGSDLLAGQAGGSRVIANFFAGNVAGRGGIRVIAKDLDGDEKADLVVGDGDGAGSRVTAYLGATLTAGDTTEEFGLDAFSGFTGGVFVG